MNNKMQNSDPLACDPVTGICEIPAEPAASGEINLAPAQKPVRLLYFTDPICSSCWGIEPQLRRLKLEYGAYLEIDYRMGGLLPSWDTYGGRDVRNPVDVAQHWDEAGAYYEMPIDGNLWLEDPLPSSYPPSIAFKAAQMQDSEKALAFLRKIKEMIFLEKKNIAKLENLQQAASETGLDSDQLTADIAGPAKKLFLADLELAKKMGVRGFPSLFFSDAAGNRLFVYGSKPYEHLENALKGLYPEAVKQPINKDYAALFGNYPTLTTKEFAVLADLTPAEAESQLQDLNNRQKIGRYQSRNGSLWTTTLNNRS